MRANEGKHLVDGHQEGNGINGAQQTKDHKAGEPVGRGSAFLSKWWLLRRNVCFVVHIQQFGLNKVLTSLQTGCLLIYKVFKFLGY